MLRSETNSTLLKILVQFQVFKIPPILILV